MVLSMNHICLALILLVGVSSYSIKPLRAGSIQVTDL
jgi:hypothetical protein